MQRHTLLLFWRTTRRTPVTLAISLCLPVTTVLIGQFAGPYLVAIFFNRLQSGDRLVEGAWPLVIGFVLTQVYGEVIGWRITLYAMWRMELEGQRHLYRRTFAHLLQQSLGFHNDRFGGALVSQSTKLLSAYERFWDMIVWEVVPVATSLVAASTILAFLFWQYAVVLAVLSVVFVAAVLLSSRFMVTLTTAETQASTRLTGRLADVVTNIAAVKSFGREADELASYDGMIDDWQHRSLRAMRGFLGVTTGYSVLLLITKSAAVIAALVAVQHGSIAAGTVYLALTYTFSCTQQLWEVTQIVRDYNRSMGDAYDMTEILQVTPAVVDLRTPAESRPVRGGISFDRIRFTHAGDSTPLFDRFDLAIAPGERVGLVGASGSGKTTLTRLLLRFADLDGGTIRIDGQDIARMRQSDLRRSVSYVPQEPLLFHRTLRDNIAYGRPHAGPDQVREAAVKANAWEFIERLPDGLDTLVGERGVKLSGGQRQRIAIARAILKDAPVLVLDEATSALDSESEVAIQAALVEAMRGRTTLVIAHRLSTIRSLDRIVVLADGRVVEQGSHDELVARGGDYAGLWRHQSGGFLTEEALSNR